MCGPNLHLNNREKYFMRANAPHEIVYLSPTGKIDSVYMSIYDARHHAVQVNMRRIERLSNAPAPFDIARGMLTRWFEEPLELKDPQSAIMPQIRAITERGFEDTPIDIPDNHYLGVVVSGRRGFFITAGPTFLEMLRMNKPGAKSISFYERCCELHSAAPRFPLLINM